MPDTDTDEEKLEPTFFELEQARHAKVTRQNEIRERRRVAAANRAADRPEPKPGDKMYVSIADRNLSRRTRAGVAFEGAGARKLVQVVDLDDDEVAIEQAAGRDVVNPWGAERILADEALMVHQRSAASDDATAEALRKRNAELEEEVRVMRAEAAKLRQARQAALDKGEVIPRGARGGGPPPAAKPADETEFGGKDGK